MFVASIEGRTLPTSKSWLSDKVLFWVILCENVPVALAGSGLRSLLRTEEDELDTLEEKVWNVLERLTVEDEAGLLAEMVSKESVGRREEWMSAAPAFAPASGGMGALRGNSYMLSVVTGDRGGERKGSDGGCCCIEAASMFMLGGVWRNNDDDVLLAGTAAAAAAIGLLCSAFNFSTAFITR